MHKSRNWAAIFFTLVGVAGFFLWVLRLPPFGFGRIFPPVRPDVSFLTEPLLPDGRVDYLAGLNQKSAEGVTPENNAVALLVKVFHPSLIREQSREQFFKELGVPIETVSATTLVTFAKYVEKDPAAQELNQAFESATKAPWNRKEHPRLVQFLEHCQPGLAIVREASLRSRWYTPYFTAGDPNDSDDLLLTILLSYVQESRSLASMLSLRAMLRIQEGDTSGAIDDLFTIRRMGGLVSQGFSVIETLVGYALIGIADDRLLDLAHQGKFTADQLATIQNELDKPTGIRPLADTIHFGERCMTLQIMQLGSRDFAKAVNMLGADGSGVVNDDFFSRFFVSAAGRRVDWTEAMRSTNAHYDSLVAGLKLESPKERLAAANQIIEQSLAGRRNPVWSFLIGGNVASQMLAAMLPAMGNIARAEDRFLTRLELCRLAIALVRAKTDLGSYPEKLADLTPKYRSKIPTDRQSEGPFAYKRSEKGYIVYSIGIDQKDDGGKEDRLTNPGKDDIAVGPDAPKPDR